MFRVCIIPSWTVIPAKTVFTALKEKLLIRLLSEHSRNFLHGLVLRLRNFLPDKQGEEGEEDGENEEHMASHGLLKREESEADEEVGRPVDADCDGSCGGTSRLVEELRNEEPRDGSRPDREHYHEDDNEKNREV